MDVGAFVGGIFVRDVAVGGRVGARRAVMVSWKRRRGWAMRDMADSDCVCCPSVFWYVMCVCWKKMSRMGGRSSKVLGSTFWIGKCWGEGSLSGDQ
jgi:hypothetical protein